MTFAPRTPLRKAAVWVAAALGLSVTHCAGLFNRTSDAPTIHILPSERLFFQVAPFDSTVKAELARGGVDPETFEQEFAAELKYRFNLRKQEEAQDSVGAVVILLAQVHHLQPGVGNAGMYGEFEVTGRRRSQPLNLKWKLEAPSTENKPQELLARDLLRASADEFMKRVRRKPPAPRDPPPPLMLLR